MSRVKYLDGLRGLAALFVFIGHYNMFFGNISSLNLSKLPAALHFPLTAFFMFITNGNLSVAIFFVLSGFALSYPFFSTRSHDKIVTSAVKRYFRLVVPILASVLFIYILYAFKLFYSKSQLLALGLPEETLVLYNGKMDVTWLGALINGLYSCLFEGSQDYNYVLWTMMIEFYGSFLVFAALGIVGNSSVRYYAYLALILYFINTYYYLFIVGIIISDLYCNPGTVHYFNKPRLGSIFIMIGIFLAVFHFNKYLLTHLPLGEINTPKIHAINRVAALFIVVGVVCSSFFQKILSNKFFTFLGDISFVLYLFHIPLMSVVSVWLLLLFSSTFSYEINIEVVLAITTVLLLLFSKYVLIYVDKAAIVFSAWVARTVLRK